MCCTGAGFATLVRHVCVMLAVLQEEVVAWANNVKYGLAGSVWTNNLQRGHRVAHSIDAGILWVNCWLHRCVLGASTPRHVARLLV